MPEILLIQGYMTDEEGPLEDTFADIYISYSCDGPGGDVVVNIEADLLDDPQNWDVYQGWGGLTQDSQDFEMKAGQFFDPHELRDLLEYPVTEWKWEG